MSPLEDAAQRCTHLHRLMRGDAPWRYSTDQS